MSFQWTKKQKKKRKKMAINIQLYKKNNRNEMLILPITEVGFDYFFFVQFYWF